TAVYRIYDPSLDRIRLDHSSRFRPLPYPARACGAVPMASPPSPRLLCALLGDRLAALSARPLLRTAAPGRG
uniref:Uncharacterized protein n=1 Tax=Aegilops tauschii subsp. strangulata TaxID=200361 RepID=A0A453PNN2_AEGTS